MDGWIMKVSFFEVIRLSGVVVVMAICMSSGWKMHNEQQVSTSSEKYLLANSASRPN